MTQLKKAEEYLKDGFISSEAFQKWKWQYPDRFNACIKATCQAQEDALRLAAEKVITVETNHDYSIRSAACDSILSLIKELK